MKENKLTKKFKKEKGSSIRGVKISLIGLTVIAVATFIILGLRVFISFWQSESVILLQTLIGWLFVLFGTMKLKGFNYSFKLAYYASLASTLFVLAEIGFAIKGIVSGLKAQAFIEFDVMFFNYAAVLGMLFVYRKLIQGIAPIALEKGYPLLEKSGLIIWRRTAIGLLVTMFLIPMVSVFPFIVETILASIFDIVLLFIQIYLCQEILKAYRHITK